MRIYNIYLISLSILLMLHKLKNKKPKTYSESPNSLFYYTLPITSYLQGMIEKKFDSIQIFCTILADFKHISAAVKKSSAVRNRFAYFCNT